MKKKSISMVFSLALVAGLFFVSSCKDDDDDKCYICEESSSSGSSSIEFCEGNELGLSKEDFESDGYTCTVQ